MIYLNIKFNFKKFTSMLIFRQLVAPSPPKYPSVLVNEGTPPSPDYSLSISPFWYTITLFREESITKAMWYHVQSCNEFGTIVDKIYIYS